MVRAILLAASREMVFNLLSVAPDRFTAWSFLADWEKTGQKIV